jgi:hypothetical protein
MRSGFRNDASIEEKDSDIGFRLVRTLPSFYIYPNPVRADNTVTLSTKTIFPPKRSITIKLSKPDSTFILKEWVWNTPSPETPISLSTQGIPSGSYQMGFYATQSNQKIASIPLVIH